MILYLLFSDDPYYCGLRARIPNFVKKKKKTDSSKQNKGGSGPGMPPANAMMNLGLGKGQPPMPAPAPPHHPFWWHSRLYTDSSGQYSKYLRG